MLRAPRTLVRRLVFTFLLPTLVILVAGASIAYVRATAALRESVIERLDAIATVKESAFETWVGHLLHDVAFLSALPEVRALAADLGIEGPPSATRTNAHLRLSDLLELALEQTPGFTEVFFLAPGGGGILASTDESHEGQFRIYDRYYVEGRRAPFVQNVYPSPVTLRPTLTLSAPVKSAGGSLLGVVAAHLSLDVLDRSILGRTGLGHSGQVTLVDRHKVVVTGKRYGDLAFRAATSVAIEEVSRGHDGDGLYHDAGGSQVIGVYRWLEARELGLIVEIGQQEAFAPARQLALFILLAGSIFLLLLIAGLYLAARSIARPILAITGAATKVSEGDLSSRAPVAAEGEIGALAGTFNHMVERLAADTEARRQAATEREALIAELEAKNAELERFTYTVSHDLKSPLLTIKGFLGYLLRDFERGDAERVRADAARISGAAEKMARLLDELLELSRIGLVAGAPEAVPFGDLARQVAETIGRRDHGRNVEIDVASDLPVVRGDRVRLREVLENLVENACRFIGDQASPRIEIGWRRDDDHAVLYVRDNGIGVAPEYHEKIFDLFDRLDHSIEGTGIGLAIVRRIVEVHGGKIWVESEGDGSGSTFCFTLPEA